MTEYPFSILMLTVVCILTPCSLALWWILHWLMQWFPVDLILFIASFIISWLMFVCIVLEGNPSRNTDADTVPSLASRQELVKQLHSITLSYNVLAVELNKAYAANGHMALQLEQQKKALDEAKQQMLVHHRQGCISRCVSFFY